MATNNFKKIQDIDLSKLNIQDNDKFSLKFMMLVEGTYGVGVRESIKKYGYSEQRYYQLKKSFMEIGSDALADKKRGPKKNYVRTSLVVKLVIRMRFCNPESSAAVIAQKLTQTGMRISQRSVERIISSYGLQKKTSFV